MKRAGLILVALIALEHLAFLVLEMFLFQTPIGLENFRMSQQTADTCVVFMRNQGLYNGFLAAGLVTATLARSPLMHRFCLVCIIVAGIYASWTFGELGAALFQALPALLALLLLELGSRRSS